MGGSGRGQRVCTTPTPTPCSTPAAPTRRGTGSPARQPRIRTPRPTRRSGSTSLTRSASRISKTLCPPTTLSPEMTPETTPSLGRSPWPRMSRWPARTTKLTSRGRGRGPIQAVHDPGPVRGRAGEALELAGEVRIGLRPEHRVTVPGPLAYHRHPVIEIKAESPGARYLVDPHAKFFG